MRLLVDAAPRDCPKQVCAVGECFAALLQSYTGIKNALGAQLNLAGNMAKQPVADFLREMELATKNDDVKEWLPAEYVEVEAKLAAYRAIVDKSYDELARILGEAQMALRLP